MESWAGNVVGTGIKPSSNIIDPQAKDSVQKLWLRWTDESDAEGYTDFYGQQRRAARELYIAGEVIFRFRPRQKQDGLSVPIQLQMLPSEMLPLHDSRQLGYGHVIRQGIEFDRIGRRVAYHFYKRHPGDSTETGACGEQVRVPAESVLHIIDPVEAGQLRGFSRYAPVLGDVKIDEITEHADAVEKATINTINNTKNAAESSVNATKNAAVKVMGDTETATISTVRTASQAAVTQAEAARDQCVGIAQGAVNSVTQQLVLGRKTFFFGQL